MSSVPITVSGDHYPLDNGFKWTDKKEDSAYKVVTVGGHKLRITIHSSSKDDFKSINNRALEKLAELALPLGVKKESVKAIRFEGTVDNPDIKKIYKKNEKTVDLEYYKTKLTNLKINDPKNPSNKEIDKKAKIESRIDQMKTVGYLWSRIFDINYASSDEGDEEESIEKFEEEGPSDMEMPTSSTSLLRENARVQELD